MSFEPPRRGSSARGSMDGRPRSLRPTSGRAGAAAPSAYAGVGVRAVATGPSHLTQREFQFSFDAIASARDRASARSGTRPPPASARTTSSSRVSSARRGDFAGSHTSVATHASRSLRDDGSIGSTREASTQHGMRQSTAGTTAGRTASAARAASARPSSRLLNGPTALTPTRVGFGTHDPSSRVGTAAGAARATRDATTRLSSFSETRRVDGRVDGRVDAAAVAARPATAAAPSRHRSSARGNAVFSPTMSTEGAIEAAYRRARGEFADAEDMVAEEVEARRALAPPAANTTSVSRAEATARLHKGVPVSPGVASGVALGRASTGGVRAARPATAVSAGAAARADGFSSASKTCHPYDGVAGDRARAGAASTPRIPPGSPAISLARAAAATARSLATDPARAHDDAADPCASRREPTRASEKQKRERLDERLDERLASLEATPGGATSGNPPGDRRSSRSGSSGAVSSAGAGATADATASARLEPRAREAPSPPPSKAVTWAPSPTPARPRRAASAAPGGRAPVAFAAAAAASRADSAAPASGGEATPPTPLTERNGSGATSSAGASSRAASARPVMRLADVDDSGRLPGYVLGEVVGEGGFCKVRLGIHQVSGAKTAVKLIDKSKLSSESDRKRVRREIRVLKRLTHRNVVRLFDVVETASRIFCVMEFADGGSVLDHVRARRSLDEKTAASFTAQIADALDYCHRNWIVHRDVKLENVLLDRDKRRVVLVDFGLSAVFEPGKKLTVHCGSPSYAAPEIVSRKPYDGPPVDVWSMGVVAFAMVAGYLPFHAKNSDKRELCRKIVRGAYATPESASEDFKAFASSVLRVDPERRATLARCMDARWIRNARTESGSSSRFPGFLSLERDSSARLPSRGGSDSRASPTSFPAAPSGAAVDQARVDALVAAGMDRADLVRHLEEGEHNYHTAAYHLLAYRDAGGAGDAAEAARSARGPAPKPSRAVSSARGGGATRDATANAAKRIGARPATAMERRREAATAAETLRRLNF